MPPTVGTAMGFMTSDPATGSVAGPLTGYLTLDNWQEMTLSLYCWMFIRLTSN